jgi:hypothetical protein
MVARRTTLTLTTPTLRFRLPVAFQALESHNRLRKPRAGSVMVARGMVALKVTPISLLLFQTSLAS